MSVRWELPRDDTPGSLTFLGRQLRRHYPREATLDGRMAELIEQLDAQPGVRSALPGSR
ncbi:hypothetical protein HZF05_07100 [Sphingomonas sp. CGMCC 1.13654]|uniref:Uncharacterized protein n=1 Tax=Sphingomonas chungangi TaxID=2683589 RepID=A0A838L4A4_9SPHN|nr:hypothetical protein [Sphingomonas chungangi]MBA2933867.1 hypothetical protein [Sphingomonas chungangi]MVW55197.1 hypothetical protein [Sphingomonas chungangi]